jgi:hypothetical protein
METGRYAGPETTPWVHEWSDPATRERYIFHAKSEYENSKARAQYAQSAQLEYAKWILASFLAIHGGAIYSISSLRSSVPNIDQAALSSAAFLNVGGICFAIVTAIMAWFNFRAIDDLHSAWVNPATIYRSDVWPQAPKRNPIGATYFLAISFGAVSLYLFICSAVAVSQTLSAALSPK